MKGQYLYNSFLKQISTDFRRGWDALPRILTHKTNFIASYGTLDYFLGILSKKLLNYNSICCSYFFTSAEELVIALIEASYEKPQTSVE